MLSKELYELSLFGCYSSDFAVLKEGESSDPFIPLITVETKEFNQEEFSFNISISKALIIAIFIIAGLILINEIPNLFKQLFLYYQKKQMTHATTKGDFSYIILSAVKVIIALLLIGERKKIVDFIDK